MTDLQWALGNLGERLLGWVGPMTLWTAAIVAAALLLDRVLERRVGAAWRIVPFAAVAARLALPMQWSTPLAVGRRAVSAAFPAITIAGGQTKSELGWSFAAGAVYVAVVAALLARWLLARITLHGRLADARPARPELAALARPGVLVVEHPSLGPLVAGVVRPRIVIPTNLAETLPPEALGCVVRHETAHVARRDQVLAALIQLVTIAAWPVLPVWVAAWRVRSLVEMACDEAALADPTSPGRRRYGEVLLSAASWPRTMPLAQLSFGSALARRIAALRLVHRWAWPLQATLAVVIVAALVTCSGTGADDEIFGTSSDDLNVRLSSGGSVDATAIVSEVKRQAATVKACYETEAAKNPALVGKVVARFTIQLNGETTQRGIESSTLANPAVESCIVSEIAKWQFPQPTGGAVDVSFPFVFSQSPDDAETSAKAPAASARLAEQVKKMGTLKLLDSKGAEAPVAPQPPAAGPLREVADLPPAAAVAAGPASAASASPNKGLAEVHGALDKEIIRRIIRRHINEVKLCYERELASQPALQGRVMVQFTIAASGQVVASVLQDSTLANAAAETCIVNAVRGWEFPKPLGDGIVIVSYPFVLMPGP